MKMNKSELTRMINQIDEDLLNEAAEEYHASNIGIWKRVIPVAACITLLILGAAVSVLRNITIERGHEGIEGTAVSENKGEQEDASNDLQKSYIIQMDSGELHTIGSILEQITDSFKEKGIVGNLAINSMELRLLPKDTVISNGRITLTNTSNFTDITISISQNRIVIDSKEQEKETTQRNSETATAATEEVSRVSWDDFCGAASYIQNVSAKFKDSEYMLIGANFVAKILNMGDVPKEVEILTYDGVAAKVENREELQDITYSYAFFISVYVQPDAVANDILVVVK